MSQIQFRISSNQTLFMTCLTVTLANPCAPQFASCLAWQISFPI
jgi:hypothetical protein